MSDEEMQRLKRDEPDSIKLAAELIRRGALRCGRGACENLAESPHPCPYASELYGSEDPCTCCDSCAHECAMDI